MATGKYLSLEEARKQDKLEQFCKEHPSRGDWDRFDAALHSIAGAEAASGIETSERDLHGAAPAGQKYCTWIELAAPGLPEEAAFQAVGAGQLAQCRDTIAGVSWLDFVIYAPGAAE